MKAHDHLINAFGMVKKAKGGVLANRSMNKWAMYTTKSYVCFIIFLLAFILCAPVVAATPANAAATPKPGNYCQSPGTLLVVAEELSASLDLVMRSRAALREKKQSVAMKEMESAGTLIHLAASRGAAARTIMLIDSITQAKVNKDYTQLLTWFPVLHMSLQTMPEDATTNAADDLISHAEDKLQRIEGIEGGDPFKYLSDARHILACDDLDIPLHSAMQAQGDLLTKLGQRTPPKASDYDGIIESLRNALTYALQRNEK
jgi:hypothetical protein